MKHLLLLLCLLLPLLSTAQAPRPRVQVPTVTLPASQAAIIFRTLKSYERFKPAYVETRKANMAWRMTHAQDSVAALGQQRLIGWYQSNYAQEQELRQNADREALLWKAKARRRGLLLGVAIGLPFLYGTYQLLK